MTGIKNWAKFQHFKDRKPPWVKLYRDLLDDKEWHKLDPKAAKMLVSFWLIASEYDGNLPDIETLAFRLRTTEKDIQTVLSMLSHWLGQDDINAISQEISDEHQDDSPEREGETETETEKASLSAGAVIECPHDSIIALFHEICPMLPRVKVWTDARKSNLRQRWREDQKRQSLDYWRLFFGAVSESDFLTGKAISKDRRPFIASLDWLVKPENFAKVIEKKYVNGKGQTHE